MPRNARNVPDDSDMTLRLKHGRYTIFLFAAPDWTFSRLTEELLEILRDRYPAGLTSPTKTTPIPEPDSDVKIAYAVPQSSSDLTKGWRNLKASDDDTLADKRVGDLATLAFALIDPEADENDVEFQVEVPVLDDEYGEEE